MSATSLKPDIYQLFLFTADLLPDDQVLQEF